MRPPKKWQKRRSGFHTTPPLFATIPTAPLTPPRRTRGENGSTDRPLFVSAHGNDDDYDDDDDGDEDDVREKVASVSGVVHVNDENDVEQEESEHDVVIEGVAW